jgi:hypothetical protein
MLSRAFSILLITAIFNCPLCCSWGAGSVRSGDTAKTHCRGCCHSPAKSESGEQSCPLREPGKCCQCICGGAIVGDAVAQDIGFDASLPMPVANRAVVSVPAQYIEFLRIRTTPWPDDGVNVGRAMCCLYSTFLC